MDLCRIPLLISVSLAVKMHICQKNAQTVDLLQGNPLAFSVIQVLFYITSHVYIVASRIVLLVLSMTQALVVCNVNQIMTS